MIALIDFRYQFLVFNFSIDFMKFSRFLLLPESRKYFLKPLQHFSKALEQFKDIDIEWRVILLRQLILCFNECSKKEEISKHSCMLLDLSKCISIAVLRESQVFLLSNTICESKDIKPSSEVICPIFIVRLIFVLFLFITVFATLANSVLFYHMIIEFSRK